VVGEKGATPEIEVEGAQFEGKKKEKRASSLYWVHNSWLSPVCASGARCTRP